MAITKEIELKVNSDEAVKGIEKVDDSLKEATGSQNELAASTLASAKSFKFMGVSINSVSKALKILKVSLIATGIGAIVVAVGSLAAAFLSTQDGANFLTRALEPLKEILATVWGVAQDLGKALTRIITGDLVGGWEDMGKAVDGFGQKMTEAWVRGKQLAELEISLAETEANHIRVLSRLNLQREKHRATVDDETSSLKERQAAATSLSAVNEAIFKLEQGRLQQELELLQKRTEANDTDFAAKVEIARKEAELNQAAADREKARKEEFLIARRLGSSDEDGNLLSPVTGLSTPQLREILDEQLEVIMDSADVLSDFVKKRNEEDNIILQKSLQEKIAIIGAEIQREIGLAVGLASSLSIIAEEGSKEQKALQIYVAVLSTLSGAVAAFMGGVATIQGPYGLVLGAVLAAATLAAGFANIQKMNQVQPGKSSPSANFSASVPQQPSFNVVGTSDTNQLANTVSEQTQAQQQPVKAFVVASDVTTQQSMDRNIVDSASFG